MGKRVACCIVHCDTVTLGLLQAKYNSHTVRLSPDEMGV